MKTKQEVKLLFSSPLWLISNGIRYSHNNHNKSDSEDIKLVNGMELEAFPNFGSIGEKDYDLIKRIGFHMNHSSTLEHSLIVYHLKLTTKALLEFSRHRIGLSMTVTSSRYSLGSMGIEFEPTGDVIIDTHLKDLKDKLDYLVEHASKKQFDRLAELLPQAFLYKGQFTFNLRSLVHFLELRTNKSAHRDIIIIAYKMFESLPDDYKDLILCNKTILKQIEQIEKEIK